MPSLRSLPHRRAVVRVIAALCAAVVAVALGLCATADASSSVRTARIERLNARIAAIYTDDYQQAAHEALVAERDATTHGVDDIFVKDNPYGTNTTSLYVYFTSRYGSNVTYTVSADGYPDFTRQAYQDDDYPTEHEFLVLGLIPGVTNTITFTLTDDNGLDLDYTIEHDGPTLLGDEETRLERTVEPDEGTDLGDGLYAVMGNDSNDQDFLYYYDTDGVLRGEIPLKYYRAHRLLFSDGLMWFSASTHTMVGMDRLGRLEKIYDLSDDYILHHDYALDADGNIVLLATQLGRDDHAVQDQVVKLDTTTGETTPLLDFGELLADYKQSTEHAGIDESDPDATDRWDWLHCNTIQMMDDGSAIFSARETSTIIKIDDLEGEPTLDWMVGEESVWNGSGYEDAFLAKDGAFSDTGGQHSVTVVTDDTLPDGQYYLYMFDNNYGYASTRPDYDWSVIDGISTQGLTGNDEARSQYRRYLVDENARTYSETAAFDVPYSPYVSSAQELSDGHILIDTGQQGLFGVYDQDGTLLAQYRMALATSYVYRVYQYGFKGFYFA